MKFNKKLAALALVLTSGLVYQSHRKPTMDTTKTVIEVRKLTAPRKLEDFNVVIPTPLAPTGKPQMIMSDVTGATSDEMTMLKTAEDEDNQVLSSDCFKNNVLNFPFTERNVDDTTAELTNQQIYDHISTKPVKYGVNVYDGTWWQRHVSKTMGYDIGDGVVYMDRYFADTPEIMGSLNLHEAEGHGQGFHHYYVFDTSIPYKFNDFFDLCLGKK